MKSLSGLAIGLAVCVLPMGMSTEAADASSRLGADLTPVGADKAGNTDGTIPAWTGGDLAAPPGWAVGQPRPDPYGSEKPLLSITAANADKYRSKLSPGQVELLKTIKGYRMDIYPTHRSCGFPQIVYDRTKDNARIASIASDGFDLGAATGSGFPFPLPKNGVQAMWNHKLRWQGEGRIEPSATMVSPPKGGSDFIHAESVETYLVPFQSPDTHSIADANGIEFMIYQSTLAPPALAGTNAVGLYKLSTPNDGWAYFPGQRRVRRITNLVYDAPVIGMEGTYYMDQLWMYSGKLDRYTYKLVGKQELYVPYNSFELRNRKRFSLDSLFGLESFNQDARRYELHRVWKIEADVRPGYRHAAAQRVFYLDEDTWDILVEDLYDAQGKIQRVQEGSILPIWELGACGSQEYTSYDLAMGRYFGDYFVIGEAETDWLAAKKGQIPRTMFTEDYLRREGVR